MLANDDYEHLARNFVGCEIKGAIFDMNPFKVPGPDGFQALFYQRNWDLVGSKLIQLAKNALQGKELPQSLNDTHLVLIPNVENPQNVTQLWPIGLCNVLTKVIVNWLKPILSKLVAPTQSSFVPGRQMSDNIIIVQEVLHTMRRKQGKTGLMAVKVDVEKAYDRLRWPFIRVTLQEARLPQLMVEVIMSCITTASFKVLWHGSLTDEFKPTRGIRQGDPLSPYIFVLCMERLSHLIEEALGTGALVFASSGGPPLSHLFFADDLIVFGEATVEQALAMKLSLIHI